MNAEQIKDKVVLYIPGIADEITDAEVIAVINEALTILGDMGLVYGNITAEAVAGEWLALPEDATIISVITSNGEIYEGWQVRGDKIMFRSGGTYVINARRIPPLITEPDEELQLHPMFQQCIVEYLRGFFKVRVDDLSQDGHRLLARFEESALRVFNLLRRQTYPMNWKVVRR